MKIAASFSMGRLAPKHDLNIHGSRSMSPNVTPNLIKDDVILVDHLRTQTGAYKSISYLNLGCFPACQSGPCRR